MAAAAAGVRSRADAKLEAFLSTTYISRDSGASSSMDSFGDEDGAEGASGEEWEAVAALAARVRREVGRFERRAARQLTGRQTELRLLVLCLFSQQHILLLGPSGIGKSLLSDLMLRFLVEDEDAGSYTFSRQLNRFTTPEELFGPLSVVELQRDNYMRLTDRYLPQASLAFLDEAFKASSSILNSLLTILNERTFCEQGACAVLAKVPLLMCIFSSNEIPHPSDTSVTALFDRILVRVPMRPLQGEQLKEMLFAQGGGSQVSQGVDSPLLDGEGGGRVTREEILMVKAGSERHVAVPKSVVILLKKLRVYLRTCLEPPVHISDRRLIQIVQLLRVCACLNGRRFVNRVDCLLLEYMVWDHEVKHMTQVRTFLQNELLAINQSEEEEEASSSSSAGRSRIKMQFDDPNPFGAVEAHTLDTQKLLTKRCDKVFRDATEHYEGAIYVKGDTMSARYTAYRRGKLRQRSRELKRSAATNAALDRLMDKIRLLTDELEKGILDKSEFMDTRGVCNSLQRHQFLSDDYVDQLVSEVEPKLLKAWRFHTTLLQDLYLLEACLLSDLPAEAVVTLFPNKFALFSKKWRTAL